MKVAETGKKKYRRNKGQHKSKRWKNLRKQFPSTQVFTLQEAIKHMKDNRAKNFVETVDICMKLDIDPRHSDQQIRGSFSLPHGTGKTRRVIAFAEAEAAEEAKAAGADAVGGKELVDKIADGWFEFDVAIAHPTMMRFVGKLGRTLGPKGLMPSPKAGTVTEYIGNAVKEFKAGKVEYRNDSFGNIHVGVGKIDFSDEKIAENVDAFIKHITSIRPAAVKGQYVSKIVLSSTMGLGYRLNV